jgi:hypothetical protein
MTVQSVVDVHVLFVFTTDLLPEFITFIGNICCKVILDTAVFTDVLWWTMPAGDG